MTHLEPKRLIVLGDRLICWEVLKMLSKTPLQDIFDLRILVSDLHTHRMYTKLTGKPPLLIDNQCRHDAIIIDAVLREEIDILLSVQYNWILGKPVLDAVNGQAFNLHNARLPDYKGYNSVSHAILNGDSIYESTVHWMVEDVDAGDIAYVGLTEMRADDTARSLYLRSVPAAVSACRDLLCALAFDSPVPRRPMVAGSGTFFEKGSVSALADLSRVEDPERRDLIARAVFFPPHNIAYYESAGLRYYVIPKSGVAEIKDAWRIANQPNEWSRM